MASSSTRRLLKESSDLHKNPSPYFTASPTGDGNLHDWHFTLAGPPSSPYSQGLYHGRITFPATYPLRPPSFRFLTPSGRFEVNREICLSISGHHEETWQPAWGVRTALLAIRSEIFGSESKGQVGGMEGSEELRKEYARLSLDWTCRECGVGNLEGMKDVWDSCRELGIEVDLDIARGTSDAHTGAEAQNSVQTQDESPVTGNENPELVQREATSHENVIPVAPVQAPEQVPLPAVIPTQNIPIQLPMVESPSESVWLDRAIIGVVIALVLLILRRVSNVDDL